MKFTIALSEIEVLLKSVAVRRAAPSIPAEIRNEQNRLKREQMRAERRARESENQPELFPVPELPPAAESLELPPQRELETVTLSACAARVFVQTDEGSVAGIETLVFADGAVTLPAKIFRDVLKTYKGTRLLTFETDPNGLRIQNFHMPVLAYDPCPVPPADFHVFPASDASALTGAKPPLSEREPR